MLKVLTLVVAVFLASSHAHMYVFGSRGGVTPVDTSSDFFSLNPIGPCGGSVDSVAQYINVTKNDVFTISWALIVNHNAPPAVPGTISFGYSQAPVSSSSSFNSLAPDVTVTNNPTNHYYPITFPVPDIQGSGTIQIVYDVNGASSPYPIYYQCVDIYVQ